MEFVWRCLILLVTLSNSFAALVVPTLSVDTKTKCFDKQSDIVNVCTNEFHGTSDGPRCYFIVDFDKTNPANNWASAWTACDTYGSRLAQLHTASEYKKARDFAVNNLGADFSGGIPIMLALKDLNALPTSSCIFNSNTIKWYDDESSPSTGFVLNITSWIARAHSCDDSQSQGQPRCFRLYPGLGVDDFECTQNMYALCQFTGSGQNYTQATGCLAESPTESISSVTAVKDCADLCTAKAWWCRSFNFVLDTVTNSNTCELFSWSFSDTTAITTSRPGCFGYNYEL